MVALLFALMQVAAPVQGSVRVAGTLEPIPYATVDVIGTDRHVTADVRGFFTLASVQIGRQTLRARALGYAPVTREIEIVAGISSRIEFVLTPLPSVIETVRVSADPAVPRDEPPGPPPVRLDIATLRMAPALAEVDVLRALQMLPSVQQASDFSSGLYVRGGSPDQTLVALDGMPLFNPYHLGGIFAAVDPDAVATLDMWPGAMPARVGDRLSGLVQIWTREGGRDKVRSRGSIGLVSTRASVDGPLPGGGGSYLFSARRTYLDLFTQAATKFGLMDNPLPYHFTDAHLKLVHDVGELGRLSASGYYNEEQLTNKDVFSTDRQFDDDFDWGSRTVSLDWRQPFGGQFLLEARAGFSSFRSEIDFFDAFDRDAPPIQTMRGRAYMRDALGSAGLTWYLSDHELRTGLQLDAYRLEYDVQRSEDDFFADLLPQFQRADRLTSVAAFLEDEWRPAEAVSLRAGLRTLSAAGATAIMPRFGVTWRPTPTLALEIGGGRYAQTLNSFRNEESILASFLAYDVLAPGDSAGLTRSEDIVVGGEWRGTATTVRLDLYAKRFTEIAVPRLPPNPFETPLLEIERVDRGTGSARGIDLLVRREWSERRALFASYALSMAQRDVNGDRFTPRFERRHTADLLGSFPLGRRTDGSMRLVVASGQPQTPVLGRFVPFVPGSRTGTSDYEGSMFPVFVLGEHNSERLPGYWRLDLSARRSSTRRMFGREGTLTWTLHVLNVLNARNVLGAQPEAYSLLGEGQLSYTPQLPLLPTFALEWSF